METGSDMFKAACVQLRTGRSMAENIAATSALIREAAENGADLIMTPEMTSLMELGRTDLFAQIKPQDKDPALEAFRALAAELGRWLLVGSLAIRTSEAKAANRSFLIAPDGSIAASYDKLHMFDVDLAGGETYRESASYSAGSEAVTADLPWGRLGLTVCYDLRFPQLYRSLARQGACFLAIPSAFTRKTGEAHWHVLVRARAIENGCFVFAPAQGGTHENGRETFGHSLIVSPWGEILAEAGTEPGVIYADVDPAAVDQARQRIPSLQHDRVFSVRDAAPAGVRQAS
jgi:deaminated glutathione amidase